jgi:DNA repair exonuclease SbcCD nuclease subunit
MPIYLPPISRRRFLKGSLAAAGAGLLSQSPLHALETIKPTDPHRIAFLSDTHIESNLATSARNINMADHLRQAVSEILKLDPAPAHVLLNGDFAFDRGQPGDYATGVKLIAPIREAGLPLHISLGNHDHRANFLAGIPQEHHFEEPVKDKHVAVVEMDRAVVLMLDSLDVTKATPGMLGESQLAWLGFTLDKFLGRNCIVVVHHNPELAGQKNVAGIQDTDGLLEVLSPRRQAKALIYGHTHRWDHKQLDDGLHLVNLPAVAYVFSPEQPSAWSEAKLGTKGATMELHTLNPKHPWNNNKLTMKWRK